MWGAEVTFWYHLFWGTLANLMVERATHSPLFSTTQQGNGAGYQNTDLTFVIEEFLEPFLAHSAESRLIGAY